MATEERLRDELNQAADSVRPDTRAALARVVGRARRRQRVRRVALSVAAGAVVVVGAVGIMHTDLANLGKAPAPANTPSGPNGRAEPSDLHAAARTALTGEWQTHPAPAQRVRAALADHGIASALANRVMGDPRRWFVQLSFNQDEGTSALVVRTSDPTDPGSSLRTSEVYLYRLLPHDRLLVTPKHPGTRWVFAYRLSGDVLQLRLLGTHSAADDPRTEALIAAWTWAPFTQVHYR